MFLNNVGSYVFVVVVKVVTTVFVAAGDMLFWLATMNVQVTVTDLSMNIKLHLP